MHYIFNYQHLVKSNKRFTFYKGKTKIKLSYNTHNQVDIGDITYNI